MLRRFARRLSMQPEDLYELDPRVFEKLVAELFAYFGFKVDLNVQAGWGGDEVDIIATSSKPGVGYVIEYKRYRPERRVEISVASRLYGILSGDLPPMSVPPGNSQSGAYRHVFR